MFDRKKIIAGAMCLLFVAGITGCKKNPPRDSYIIEYVTESQSGDNGGNTASTDSNGNSSGNKSGNTTSDKNSSGGKKSPKKSTITINGEEHQTYQDDSGRIKDLKGRKIVFIATWDATSRASAGGKLIAETERMLNCRLEEKKLSNYQTIYTSILSGKPICDLFCPKDKSVLNMAYNKLLTPLDTLSNFDFSKDCWDQQCLKDNTLNGHIYGMSRAQQWREILFYNKDMFKSNDWPDLFELQSKGKLDWNTLYSIMEKAAVVQNGTVKRYGLVPLYYYDGLAKSMMQANGVFAVTRVGDTTEFKNNFTTSNAVMNAMNTMKKWIDLPGGVYDANTGGWDSGRAIFTSGQAAMAMIDYNQFSTVDNNADFEWGCVLFPHGPNSSRDLYIHNTTATVIPAGVKEPNDIALFWDILRDNFNESFVEEVIGSEYDKSYAATLKKYFRGCQDGYAIQDFSNEMGVSDEMVKVAKGQTTPAAAVDTVKNVIASKAKNYWG